MQRSGNRRIENGLSTARPLIAIVLPTKNKLRHSLVAAPLPRQAMIERLHWDAVVVSTDIDPSNRAMGWLAIWPSPIDADACFADAGFSQFTDTDDAWDQQWRSIVADAISDLSTFGTPAIRRRIVPVTKTSLMERFCGAPRHRDVHLTLIDQVVLASEDDNYPPAIVDFGNSRRITLVACDGHPVLWIRYNGQMAPFDRERNAKAWHDHEFTQFELNWSSLRPPKMSAEPTDEREPE